MNNLKLPKPVDDKTIKTYLIKAKNGDLDARNFIIEHNLLLVKSIAEKYSYGKFDYDDLFSEGVIGLSRAIDNFSLDKIDSIKFSYYAYACISNEIKMYIRINKKYTQIVSIDNSVFNEKGTNCEDISLQDIIPSNEPLPQETIQRNQTFIGLYDLINQLTPIQRKVIIEYFGLNENFDAYTCDLLDEHFGTYSEQTKIQSEISKELNLCQSHISRIIMNTLEELKELIQKAEEKSLKVSLIGNKICSSYLNNFNNNKSITNNSTKENCLKR